MASTEGNDGAWLQSNLATQRVIRTAQDRQTRLHETGSERRQATTIHTNKTYTNPDTITKPSETNPEEGALLGTEYNTTIARANQSLGGETDLHHEEPQQLQPRHGAISGESIGLGAKHRGSEEYHQKTNQGKNHNSGIAQGGGPTGSGTQPRTGGNNKMGTRPIETSARTDKRPMDDGVTAAGRTRNPGGEQREEQAAVPAAVIVETPLANT